MSRQGHGRSPDHQSREGDRGLVGSSLQMDGLGLRLDRFEGMTQQPMQIQDCIFRLLNSWHINCPFLEGDIPKRSYCLRFEAWMSAL